MSTFYADGIFDRAGILRDAHQRAAIAWHSAQLVRPSERRVSSYREAFAAALRLSWEFALEDRANDGALIVPAVLVPPESRAARDLIAAGFTVSPVGEVR